MSNNITVNNILFKEAEKKCNLFFVNMKKNNGFFFPICTYIYQLITIRAFWMHLVKEFFHQWN